MIRQSASFLRLLKKGKEAFPCVAHTRLVSSAADVPATPTGNSAFAEAWKMVVPNIDPPKTPLSFMTPRPPVPSSIPSKLTVNFVLPYQSELSSKEGMTWIFYAIPLIVELHRLNARWVSSFSLPPSASY
ncbi:unnamed protein product [Victoria cruziana]